MPGSLNHQKGENMRIDRSYLGNQNTYAENNPKCIVVHNTDNFAAGADARHMREHSMTGISRTFPHTITSMTVTQPTRRHRTAGGAGMSALITAEKICFSSTATRTASVWRCVCRPGIIMKKHLRILRHWCGRSCGRRGFRWKESIVIMTSAANTVRARS